MDSDAEILLAFFKFWDKWNNDTGIFDGSHLYDGKYSLIDNKDLVELDELGDKIEALIN